VQLLLKDGREITQVMLLPDAGLGDAMSAIPPPTPAPPPAADGQTPPAQDTDKE
jgi:hypothetical protein